MAKKTRLLLEKVNAQMKLFADIKSRFALPSGKYAKYT